jgi:hypothetical protein
MLKITNRNVVKYSDDFATFNTNFSNLQSKFIFSIIAMIELEKNEKVNEEDERLGLKKFRIKASLVDDAVQQENIKVYQREQKLNSRKKVDLPKDRSVRLKRFADEMMSAKFGIPNPNDPLAFSKRNFFVGFDYAPENDELVCIITKEMNTHLTNFINNHYKQAHLNNFIRFKSKYSHKFYLLLKTAKYNKSIYINGFGYKIPITWIRNWLDISEDLYIKYNDFKRFVINIVQKDFKDLNMEINFDIKEYKEARKITHIEIIPKYIKVDDFINIEDIDTTPTESDMEDLEKEVYLKELEYLDMKSYIKQVVIDNGKKFRIEDVYYDKNRKNKITIAYKNIKNDENIIKELTYKDSRRCVKEILHKQAYYKVDLNILKSTN